MRVKQFGYSALHEPDEELELGWSFSGAMVGACAPLLDDCEDNHEVEERLRALGVIDETCETDSEMCCLYIYFGSERDGQAFIDRLNTYLREKADLLERARAY